MSCEPEIAYHDETRDGHPAVPLDASTIVTAAALVPPAAPPVEAPRGNVIELPARLAMKPKPTQSEVRRRLGKLKKEASRRLAQLLLDGKPFAKRPARDRTLYKLACIVTSVAPESTVDDLAPLFEPS